MKIKNKKTGEVIDLSKPSKVEDKPAESTPSKKPNQMERFAPERAKATEERIKERGTIQDTAKKIGSEKSIVKKIGAGLEVASAPLAAVESGVANVGLEMQKGNVNPVDLLKESILGISLQKQGQYGDIMKNAGYNPVLSDTAGLVASLSPVKVYQNVAKTFGNISKMSDKALMKTGNNLIYAIDDAKKAVGMKVTQEYAKGADNLPVDGLQFINDVADLPRPIMKKMELAFGKMEDFAKNLNIGKVREFKRYLGKLKPNAYGGDARGLKDSLDVLDINKVYGKVSGTAEKVMRDKSSGLDKSTVDHLLDLDESYHDVINAGRYIKHTITDATLGKPTKVGNLAEEIKLEGNSTARVALSKIKSSSRTAMNNVNKAMDRMESFNRWQRDKMIVSRAIKAVTYGGIAGAVGGKLVNKFQDRSDS